MGTYDIAIIGAGPAGLYAYYYGQLKGLNVCLLEANSEVGGQPTMLFPVKSVHDYPGFNDIKANKLIQMFVDQIKDKSNIFVNTKIESFKKDKDIYILTSGSKTFKTKYVIIATGGGSFKFNKIDGVESDSIHYCVKSLEIYKDKKVIIAGGGDSAVDWALEIAKNKITNDLTIVHRRDEFRASGTKITELKKYKFIKVLLNKKSFVSKVNELTVEDNTNKSIVKLPFDYLIVQYGQTYSLLDNSLLKNFKLDKTNKIEVDSNGKTNLSNVYAIGNVSSINDKPRLISIAVNDALKAVEDISKIIKHYE